MSSDFHREEVIRARTRKRCRCWKANGHRCIISPGALYVKHAGLFDRQFFAENLCLKHAAMLSTIFSLDDYANSEGVEFSDAIDYWREATGGDPKLFRIWFRKARDEATRYVRDYKLKVRDYG